MGGHYVGVSPNRPRQIKSVVLFIVIAHGNVMERSLYDVGAFKIRQFNILLGVKVPFMEGKWP